MVGVTNWYNDICHYKEFWLYHTSHCNIFKQGEVGWPLNFRKIEFVVIWKKDWKKEKTWATSPNWEVFAMLEIYIKVEQRGEYRIAKASESGLLGLRDTLKIHDIDICHKREFSKMQMCEGVQTIKLTWISVVLY